MKPHIKVIQRNGVDIFVTSSMEMKRSRDEKAHIRRVYSGMRMPPPLVFDGFGGAGFGACAQAYARGDK